MRLKGVRKIQHLENTAFRSILKSLLPIFQTRLDIVAECRLMLQGVMVLITRSRSADSLIWLSEQGKLRPVKHIETSSCAGRVNWTGCRNSCFKEYNDNENVVYNKIWGVK